MDSNSRTQVVEEFYHQFDGSNLEYIDTFYHEDAVFKDPLVELHGRESIKQYFGKVYSIADFVKFSISRTYEVDHTVILFWTMAFANKRLAGGKTIELEGVSECRFDGEQVVSHVDVYDTAQMVYYHVPVVGAVLGMLKKRLH